MKLTLLEAARFSDLAYHDTNTLLPHALILEGWRQLNIGDDYNYGPNGYHASAYVHIVNGDAVDLVIAHRGTERTDLDDLEADAQLAIGLRPEQVDDARAFVAVAKERFENQFNTSSINILTHVGHSLGGYLAQIMAHEAGQDGRAITFDNPRTDLDHTDAHIVSVLNEDNYINTAGFGEQLGTVLRLDSDRFIDIPHGALPVDNIKDFVINALSDAPDTIEMLKDAGLSIASANSHVIANAMETATEHGLLRIIDAGKPNDVLISPFDRNILIVYHPGVVI